MNINTVLCTWICITVLCIAAQKNHFQFGIETLSDHDINAYALTTKRVGLVTNQTGVDQNGTPTVQILRKKGVQVTTIFVPEHGYTGTIAAGKSAENGLEPSTRIPIVSLYSHENGLVGKTINAEKFKNIDCILFDIQDSGMRHYTYISTLMRCLEACAEYNKQCVVLDRPNLLGARMEGPLVDPDLISFISIAPIPLRHGMTIGELAHYFNMHLLKKRAPLIIVKMHNYTRAMPVDTFFKKPLSPNLATIQGCLGYSFLGLLGEISPCNVGVGTPYAFRCIMLPTSIKPPASLWRSLQQLLTKYGIGSIRHTMFNVRSNKKVTGILLQFHDISHVKTFSLFLDIVTVLMKHNIVLQCAPTFDKAVGTAAIRTAIEHKQSLEQFKTSSYKLSSEFCKKIKPLFLYQPHPQVD